MKISVITPSFRQLALLRKCVASVADQTGAFTCEHLIQDGGSGEDFDRWAALEKRARIISESDQGMYDAINRGFARSDGDILAWLNCDEQYLPGTLDKVSRWFRDHPNDDILFGDVILLDSYSQPISYRKAILPTRTHIQSCFLPTYSAATFVRRRIIDQGYILDIGFRAISDAVWIDRLLGDGFKAGLMNEPLATFEMTGENLGQTELALNESEKWKRSCNAHGKLRCLILSFIHRFRKIVANAYRKRLVEILIFSHDSQTRVLRRAIVGGRWRAPHPTKAS